MPTINGKVESVRKDGSVCYMDLNECKIRLPDNSLGILCVAKDVSDQIKAEAERIIKEKMTGIVEIAGAVCHELNQPMTVISVTCDLLLMNTFDKAEIRQKLTTIKSQLDRMTKLTKKLMHLTRYETREYLNGTKIVDIDRASE